MATEKIMEKELKEIEPDKKVIDALQEIFYTADELGS